MNIESLKEKIDMLSKNLYLHENDLKKFTKKLREEYNLSTSDAKDRLEEIENDREIIQGKIKKLISKSAKLLEDVKDAIS